MHVFKDVERLHILHTATQRWLPSYASLKNFTSSKKKANLRVRDESRRWLGSHAAIIEGVNEGITDSFFPVLVDLSCVQCQKSNASS